MLCKRLNLRQRVMATASVYFQRFYSKNTYASTDPFLVLTACVYLAAKVEESAVRIRTLSAEASKMFSELGYHELPSSASVVAEMEFYLVEELEFDLIVYHPYHTLQRLCDACGALIAPDCNASTPPERSTSSPTPVRDEESARARPAQLLQMAWFIANDLYRTDLPLQHPPYVLAIACLYLALVLLPTSAEHIQTVLARDAASASAPPAAIVAFLGGLNVSLPLVASVVQDLLSYYELWHELHRPEADGAPSLLQDAPGLFARVHRMHAAYRASLLPHAPERPAAYTS
ncbi:RNA polymerase II holoenzyme cyclin-like subunit [Malassezia obtusa]|uniref:RNA polymerase II holoenzyme cyclin-like subunit n=1 Tax=Malassezia obtusa TaxID=76774 RepID=A0AAF0IS38_9BASI|nr:RNA polymerase II holoenzyme cyclin-like subunit [Malassezia obtusa]